MAQLDPLGIMDADLDSCVPTDIITSSDKLGEQQQQLRGFSPTSSRVWERCFNWNQVFSVLDPAEGTVEVLDVLHPNCCLRKKQKRQVLLTVLL